MRDLEGARSRGEDAVIEIGDTVRRVYYPRPRWYSSEGEREVEGLMLGVVMGRFEVGWLTVEWEDGKVTRGEEGCFRKVSEEEATALKMMSLADRELATRRSTRT